MSLRSKLLDRFTRWALSKNAPGPYKGEDDKRWAYTIEVNGEAYLVRVLSPRIFGCRVYLHHFLKPDAGRDLHNHPWKWAVSLILSGSYEEDRLGREGREVADELRKAGIDVLPEALADHRRVHRFNTLTDEDYHRVTTLHGDVWTLFLIGPTVQEWGFLVDGKHVPWHEKKKGK